MSSRFEVERQNFANNRVVKTSHSVLQDGEVRVKVDFFAFTANNLTYAAAGDTLRYWEFFPVESEPRDGWGVIPVWGFADVVETTVPEVALGERLYGYFPPGEELVLRPEKLKPRTLLDGSEHRATLSPLYNQYQRVAPKSPDNRAMEIALVLFGPLYTTSYCLLDQLLQQQFYQAEQVVVLSASSKTSIGLAYGLFNEASAPTTIGMTSTRNSAFVGELGLYDEVLDYSNVTELAQKPTAIVDMSGNSELAVSLEEHLGDHLSYFISVGLTHWDQNKGGLGKKSDRHEMFFAPSYIVERGGALPPGEFAQRAHNYVLKASQASLAWLDLTTLDGLDDFVGVYPEVCSGSLAPSKGLICQL